MIVPERAMFMSKIRWYDECSTTQIGEIRLEYLLANDVVPARSLAVVGEVEISAMRGKEG